MSADAARAGAPFVFADYEGLVVATGWEARNLRELLDVIRRAPAEVIHHHLFRAPLGHRAGTLDYPNDFGSWAADALGDPALAEKLSSLDLFRRGDLELTRTAVIDVLEEHLDALATVPWSRPGFEFHFASGIFFALPGLREAWTLGELRDGVAESPLSSLYYHFHEARLRGDDDEDDFSRWIEDELHESAVADRLRRIDFYLFGLEELRERIVAVLGAAAAP
ncbi:MAG TPA: DUF5752 family protein [Candidatus Sulfotelmatobacter sp.]|jgi:hypothetical protein|nr:DUF5752 family protein [Candidatus Sulfotelmatobacter sp.]